MNRADGQRAQSPNEDMIIEKEDGYGESIEEEQADDESLEPAQPNGQIIDSSTNLDTANQCQSNGVVIGTNDESNELSKLPGFNFALLFSTEVKTDSNENGIYDNSEKKGHDEIKCEPKPFEVNEQ